jgi:general secretion pathway protein A
MKPEDTALSETGMERVYLDFYHLDQAPFSITPDPNYLFYSDTHQNAINKLLYGINGRMGFLLLVGEVGTGKTTICRALLDTLQKTAETVYIINPSLSGTELLSSVLDDLGISYSNGASKKELIDTLNHYLLAENRHKPVVIIIDDAQTMSFEALEDMRLLSNLETDKDKLLQILLVGQPELLDHLSQPELRQLKQRVAITCHLDYLSKNEVDAYISRRLFISGDKGRIRFQPAAVREIYAASHGIPRLINRVCDYTLTAGYVANSYVIKRKHTKKALQELQDFNFNTTKFSSALGRSSRRLPVFIAPVVLLCAVAYGMFWYLKPGQIIPPAEPLRSESVSSAISMEQREAPVDSPASNKVSAAMAAGDESAVSRQQEAVTTKAIESYMLRLASFKTMEWTERAVALYKKRGISTHWKLVDLGPKGKWYGVYTGNFETKAEAAQFRLENSFDDAVIVLRDTTEETNRIEKGKTMP